MNWNDDFDFDGYDDMGDPDDDFLEDIIDEEFESELDEFNQEVIQESVFDFQDAFILGGMIVGQAYEDSLGEKEQQRQQDKEDDSEDLI